MYKEINNKILCHFLGKKTKNLWSFASKFHSFSKFTLLVIGLVVTSEKRRVEGQEQRVQGTEQPQGRE